VGILGSVKEDALANILQRIGHRLTELRKKKGYKSHETFSYDFNVPRMQYWRMENGKTNLTLKSLLRVLSIHKITLEDFFKSLPKESGKTKTDRRS
jgi:transcriptional regulator with XRE-family HTH domain